MEIRIGTSGWSYDHWQGRLYPENTKVYDRLGYFTQRYDTVEANNTFYHWPPNRTFEGWYARTPPGFLMTVKAARGLTHSARLHHPEEWIERIVRGIGGLREKMGILLVQLPPSMTFDYERLDYFLGALPPGLRTAVELRHESWNREETFRLLEQRQASYCIMSGAHLACEMRATAPFVYIRFHGPSRNHLYAGSYSDDDMRWWAERIREWTGQGRSVYAYFNNDGNGYALDNASTLKHMLGL